MNDFYRHKKGDKIKWIFTGIAFVLVFVFLAGLCMQLFGTGKVKPSEWFKKPDTEQTAPVDGGENKTTDGAIISESVNNGISLMSAKIAPTAYTENGISPQADTAYTLTATVSPAGEYFQTVDWAVSWVNANSAFAKNKTVTDYVTVTPVSDGALTARVVCSQAFGERIKVTASCRNVSTSKADCLVDYVKKPLNFFRSTCLSRIISNSPFSVEDGGSITATSSVFQSSSETVGDFGINSYTPYTVDCDYSVLYERRLSGNAISRFKNSSFSDKLDYYENSAPKSYCVSNFDFGFTNTLFVYSASANYRYDIAAFVATWDNPDDFEIWRVSFMGGGHSHTFTVKFGFSKSMLASYATRVSLSESNLRF